MGIRCDDPKVNATSMNSINQRSMGRRYLFFSTVGGVTGFLLWSILDLIAVKAEWEPEYVNQLDWIALVYPVVVLASSGWFFKAEDFSDRVSLILASSVLAILISIVLIFWFGIEFHLAIGGEL